MSLPEIVSRTPEYVYDAPYEIPEKLYDFRAALQATWKCLNLPPPTPVQYDIAEFLQTGRKRRMVQAFRGVGKSWITGAYCVWRQYMNPKINILVVSQSGDFAKDITKYMRSIMESVPFYQKLIPQAGQTDTAQAFDVAYAMSASKDPSVKALGISGAITGNRADVILSDDVETINNSATAVQREQIARKIKDFSSIIKPDIGEIIYLGTPQTEDSIYTTLPQQGYDVRVWPAQFGFDEEHYTGTVAPSLIEQVDENPKLAEGGLEGQGAPTDTRFNEEDLTERLLDTGRAYYTLQFMLDVRGNAHLYPLRLRDLVVMDLNPNVAPEKVVWSNAREYVVEDNVPNVGLSGDKFFGPLTMAMDGVGYLDYSRSLLMVDPSGRGSDETSWCVVKELNGFLYVLGWGGFTEGYDREKVLVPLCNLAKQYNVNMIVSESNMGDGMFNKLLEPVLRKIWPSCGLDEVSNSTRKEDRICDTLEPVMNSHRLVFDKNVIREDLRTAQLNYPSDSAVLRSGIYQMSRMMRQKGALAHDDRIDALAMAVKWFVDSMNSDEDELIAQREEEEFLRDIGLFMEEATGQTYSPELSLLNLAGRQGV